MIRKLKNKFKRILNFNNQRFIEDQQYGWFGDYDSWQEAANECRGYDQDNILEKVKNSLLKVKNGEAIYERDSVIFNHVEYSWPVLAMLLYTATENYNKLHVLDFGGSLGSSYFQNKVFLCHLSDITWNIVEQPHFVECGIINFQNDTLRFYNSITESMKSNKSDIVLFSSVLQYLHKPEEIINQVVKYKIKYIIVDITSFTCNATHRITVQRVWPEIYEASYPCWFFNEQMFLAMFEPYYSVINTFNPLCSSNLENTYYKGFILKFNA